MDKTLELDTSYGVLFVSNDEGKLVQSWVPEDRPGYLVLFAGQFLSITNQDGEQETVLPYVHERTEVRINWKQPKTQGVPVEDRHPSVAHVLQFFSYDHLPEGKLRIMSRWFSDFAHEVVNELPDDPEVTVGLRKLLEAKDCMVRAALPR